MCDVVVQKDNVLFRTVFRVQCSRSGHDTGFGFQSDKHIYETSGTNFPRCQSVSHVDDCFRFGDTSFCWIFITSPNGSSISSSGNPKILIPVRRPYCSRQWASMRREQLQHHHLLTSNFHLLQLDRSHREMVGIKNAWGFSGDPPQHPQNKLGTTQF